MFSSLNHHQPRHHGQTVETKSPGFMSATFALFGLSLLVSSGGVFFGFFLSQAYPAVFANPIVFYGAMIVELILIFTSHKWSDSLPLGYGMFGLFAFLSGLTLVPILAMAGAVGGATLIFRALIASTATFGAAALFGRVTSVDLSGMRGFLMTALIGLIIMSVLGIFIPWGNTMEIVVSGGMIILFAGFTMYDIQKIKTMPGLNPLMAAIRLYLDFINLFIGFLRLLMALKNRN
jgi:uncharacterized protein